MIETIIIGDDEKSPERIDSLPDTETPTRVELSELPVETIVQFYGLHPDSKYICKIVGSETEKKIKIWFKGNNPCAIAPLERMVSIDNKNGETEYGVIEVDKGYILPHFYYRNIRTANPKLGVIISRR